MWFGRKKFYLNDLNERRYYDRAVAWFCMMAQENARHIRRVDLNGYHSCTRGCVECRDLESGGDILASIDIHGSPAVVAELRYDDWQCGKESEAVIEQALGVICGSPKAENRGLSHAAWLQLLETYYHLVTDGDAQVLPVSEGGVAGA